jgi:hypothetical protein
MALQRFNSAVAHALQPHGTRRGLVRHSSHPAARGQVQLLYLQTAKNKEFQEIQFSHLLTRRRTQDRRPVSWDLTQEITDINDPPIIQHNVYVEIGQTIWLHVEDSWRVAPRISRNRTLRPRGEAAYILQSGNEAAGSWRGLTFIKHQLHALEKREAVTGLAALNARQRPTLCDFIPAKTTNLTGCRWIRRL